MSSSTHVLSNSGSWSLGSFVGHGSSTKLIFAWAGCVGILFNKRYSTSHDGIVSSRALTSCLALETVPRYKVVKLEAASSDIRRVVFCESGYVGASTEGGGVRGFARIVCSNVCEGSSV